MPQLVDIAGYGVVEFPDGMTDEQMSSAIMGDPDIQQKVSPSSLQPATSDAPPKTYGFTPEQLAVAESPEGMIQRQRQDMMDRWQGYSAQWEGIKQDLAKDEGIIPPAPDRATFEAIYGKTAAPYAVAAYDLERGVLNFATSPIGVGIVAGGPPAQTAAALYYGTKMAIDMPETATQRGTAAGSGDRYERIRQTFGLGTDIALAGAMLYGGPKGVGKLRESVMAPRTAEALQNNPLNRESPNAETIRSDQGQFNEQGNAIKESQGDSGSNLEQAASKQPESLAAQTQEAPRDQVAIEQEPQSQAGLLDKIKQETISSVVPENTQSMGISPLAEIPKRQDIVVKPEEIQSVDPKVEERWSNARFQETGWWDRVKQGALNIRNSFTRKYPELDPVEDAAITDTLRLFEARENAAKFDASNVLRGITSGLGKNGYEIFSRVVQLPDLLREVERGKYDGKELPFGYTPETLRADIERFRSVAEKHPQVMEALAKRKAFMTQLRDDLVNRGFLPESVKDFEEYFHHQVLEYMRAREEMTAGTSSKDVRQHKKGWQRGRTGSAKDYNTQYVEAEYEVIAQALQQINVQETLKRVKEQVDISDSVKATAKELGKDVSEVMPEGYTEWQPEQGNLWYRAYTVTERAMVDFLKGIGELTDKDFKQAVVMGGEKPSWIIPKNVAKTLNNFKPPPDNVFEKMVGAGMGKWKQWVLFNPERVVKYNVNNLSGDLDITLAYNPKIVTKYANQAAVDLWDTIINKKAPSPEIIEAIHNRAIGANWATVEVKDIPRSEFFDVLYGNKPNLIRRYWSNVTKFTEWRENILRLAAYRYFKEELASGRNHYGASIKEAIDAIKDPNERAAKLASELIGDYGNVSKAGVWMREHLMPFWSWMEINAPRYVRLIRNAQYEPEGSVGRVAGVIGKRAAFKVAGVGARAAILYGLVNLYNMTFHYDEWKELNDAGVDKQMGVILGRNSDGSIRLVRLQGALSDALAWVGLDNLPQDVRRLSEGSKTIKDQLVEAVKAPINRIIGSAQPIYQTALQIATGKSWYPDVTEPIDIRNRARHAAKAFSLGFVYDTLMGMPIRKSDDSILRLVSYSTDPKEAAFIAIKQREREWQRKVGLPAGGGGDTTDRQDALYYHKLAKKYGDEKLADKFLKQYVSLGGTVQGKLQSMRASSPMGTMSLENKSRFIKQLSPRERVLLKKAQEWYAETYRPHEEPK